MWPDDAFRNIARGDAMSDSFFEETKPEEPAGRRWRSKTVALGTLGQSDAVADTTSDYTHRVKRRRRVKTIALVALGSVGALTVFSCMMQPTQPTEENWQGADGGQVAGEPGASGSTGTGGQTVLRQSRGPSIWPWVWLMSRNSGVSSRTSPGVGGATSGFASGYSGGGAATAAPSRPSTGGSSSTVGSTTRGGFGSIGRALGGATSS